MPAFWHLSYANFSVVPRNQNKWARMVGSTSEEPQSNLKFCARRPELLRLLKGRALINYRNLRRKSSKCRKISTGSEIYVGPPAEVTNTELKTKVTATVKEQSINFPKSNMKLLNWFLIFVEKVTCKLTNQSVIELILVNIM